VSQIAANEQSDRIATEVVVVGAGIVGLAAAWRLAVRGLDVVVVDRGAPGREASWVGAGMLAPATETQFGEQELLALTLAGNECWDGFAAELEAATGLPAGLRRCGTLHLALDRDEAEALRRLHRFQADAGLPVEWLTPSRARELEPGLTPGCAGGILSPHEGEVDPRQACGALLSACERAGVHVLAGDAVVEAVLDSSSIRGVVTASGTRIDAEHVVLATGAWGAPWLPTDARPPVRPVKGQIVNLAHPGGIRIAEHAVWTPGIYVVPRADGRVCLGATVEEQGFDTTVTAGAVHELLREAYRVLPAVAELDFVEAIAGLRPGSPDNMPLLGHGALDGLIVATGHYRNGILLAPITGAVVAALVVGEEPPVPIARFAPDRFGVRA
jgi:glycine oxidase